MTSQSFNEQYHEVYTIQLNEGTSELFLAGSISVGKGEFFGNEKGIRAITYVVDEIVSANLKTQYTGNLNEDYLAKNSDRMRDDRG